MIDLIDVNVPKQHKGESRPLTRYELDMIRQEHLEKDRAKMQQKMMHENKVKAAKKAVKEFLGMFGNWDRTGAGLTLCHRFRSIRTTEEGGKSDQGSRQ